MPWKGIDSLPKAMVSKFHQLIRRNHRFLHNTKCREKFKPYSNKPFRYSYLNNNCNFKQFYWLTNCAVSGNTYTDDVRGQKFTTYLRKYIYVDV